MIKYLIYFSTLAFVACEIERCGNNNWKNVLYGEDNGRIHEDMEKCPIGTLQSEMFDSNPDYKANDGFKNQKEVVSEDLNPESPSIKRYVLYGAMFIFFLKMALMPEEEDERPINRRNVTNRSLFQRLLDLIFRHSKVQHQQRHVGQRNRAGQQRQGSRRYYEGPRNHEGQRYYAGPRYNESQRYYIGPQNQESQQYHRNQRRRGGPRLIGDNDAGKKWLIVFGLFFCIYIWSGKNEGIHEYGKHGEWRKAICESPDKTINEEIDQCLQTEPSPVRDCIEKSVPAANEKIVSFFETACGDKAVFSKYDDCIGEYQKNGYQNQECYDTVMKKYGLKNVFKEETPTSVH